MHITAICSGKKTTERIVRVVPHHQKKLAIGMKLKATEQKKKRKIAEQKARFLVESLTAPSTPHNTSSYLMDVHSRPAVQLEEFNINPFGTNEHLVLMMKCC